tara:strand:- start:376 stop:546 length:171 start_codon:yes stop_codon:yes gene_type:complete
MESLSIESLHDSQVKDIQEYNATSYGKLEMICTQMQMLQNMAHETLKRCERNKLIL